MKKLEKRLSKSFKNAKKERTNKTGKKRKSKSYLHLGILVARSKE